MTSFIFHAMVTRSFGPSYPATSSFLINNRAGRNSVWKGATLKHGIRYPELVIRNPESGIRNPESGIRNPESGICNPESGIRNPESRIENPESVNRYPESVLTRPNKVETAVHGFSSWLSVSTLSCRYPDKLSTYQPSLASLFSFLLNLITFTSEDALFTYYFCL